MTGYEMPVCNCLACGKQFDMATNPRDSSKPKSGNITICFECGHVMAFADDMTVRELTEDEICEIAGNRDIIEIQKARKRVLDQFKRLN